MPATFIFTELLEGKRTSEDIQPDPVTFQEKDIEPKTGEELGQGPPLISGSPEPWDQTVPRSSSLALPLPLPRGSGAATAALPSLVSALPSCDRGLPLRLLQPF